MSIVQRCKWWSASVLERDPYAQFLTKKLLLRATFLLPHDRSYLGMRHMTRHPCRMFLDVGANDGVSALSFRQLNREFEILSIEASSYHQASLERIKRRLTNFDYRLIGAGEEPGEFVLHVPIYGRIPLHTAASLSLEQAQTSVAEWLPARVARKVHYETETVRVIPLDDLSLQPGIVKVDAEGFDHLVLRGLKRTIGQCRPFVLTEVHTSTKDALSTWCREHSYTMRHYDDAADCFVEIGRLQARNAYCIPAERLASLPCPETRAAA